MQMDDRLGTFEDVAARAGAQEPTFRAVRALVTELHPEAVEAASVKQNNVWWGVVGPSKIHDAYAWAAPHKAHTNLGFMQGAHLPDPDGLLEGSGKNLRHVKLKSVEDAAKPAIRTLFIAARDERKRALKL